MDLVDASSHGNTLGLVIVTFGGGCVALASCALSLIVMAGGSTEQSLRKVLGALKDSTTVGLAKVNSEYKVGMRSLARLEASPALYFCGLPHTPAWFSFVQP